jgi:hypothetical protein
MGSADWILAVCAEGGGKRMPPASTGTDETATRQQLLV